MIGLLLVPSGLKCSKIVGGWGRSRRSPEPLKLGLAISLDQVHGEIDYAPPSHLGVTYILGLFDNFRPEVTEGLLSLMRDEERVEQ